MKRELIFRAWSKDDREWIIEWSSMNGIDKDVCQYKGKHVFFFDYDDDQVSIMQFTGLKDKNGKEIYEGDIVQHDAWDYPFSIIFNPERARFVCKMKTGLTHHIDNPCLTVIGNIHDNPELLEGAS